MNLQLSDLFHKRGKSFTWEDRIADQKKLTERLNATEETELKEFAEELNEFTQEGIASVLFLEYLLEKVTKVCSQKNISIS